MAKPKVEVLVKVLIDNCIHIYIEKPEKHLREIGQIEGVTSTMLILNRNPIFVKCDPRYDTNEIAQEIRDLLLAEVPDVFKDNDYGPT